MTIVAYSDPFVVGVDTHARKHVFAIIAVPSGEPIDSRDFPATTGAGMNRAIASAARRTDTDLATLWVIEGAASYDAVLAGAVAAAGYQVT
jgi:transposase